MKKAILIGIPLTLMLGGGGLVGASILGVVKVPFLPFGKKKVLPPKDDGKGGPLAPLFAVVQRAGGQIEVAIQQAEKEKPAEPPAPPLDPEPGEKKLAKLWAEMPTDRLVALTDKWSEPALGRILAKMDEEATMNLLAILPTPRAAALSQAIAKATDERAAKVHTN